MKIYIKVLLISFCLNGYQNIAAMELLKAIQDENANDIINIFKHRKEILDNTLFRIKVDFPSSEEPEALMSLHYHLTPLAYAIKRNKEKAVRTLLELGVNPNIKCRVDSFYNWPAPTPQSHLFHPLAIALKIKPIFINENILRMLLEHGADPFEKDVTGKSPYELAQEKGVSFSLAHYRTKSAAKRKDKS